MSSQDTAMKVNSPIAILIFSACPVPTQKRKAFVNVGQKAHNEISASVVTADVTHRLPFDSAITKIVMPGYVCLFPAPAMAIAVWNFLCRFRSGILRHVNSSFVAVGLAAGRSNVAAAFCYHYTTDRPRIK